MLRVRTMPELLPVMARLCCIGKNCALCLNVFKNTISGWCLDPSSWACEPEYVIVNHFSAGGVVPFSIAVLLVFENVFGDGIRDGMIRVLNVNQNYH